MSIRTKQLALELLSLDARYSAEEFRAVEKAFSQEGDNAEILRILRIVDSLGAHRSVPKASSPQRPTDRVLTKSRLLATLRKASMGRVHSVAMRLHVDNPSDERSLLINQIDQKLKSLTVEELKNMLRSGGNPETADQGFLGLADFILNNGDETKKKST